jgi:hypothetical protein
MQQHRHAGDHAGGSQQSTHKSNTLCDERFHSKSLTFQSLPRFSGYIICLCHAGWRGHYLEFFQENNALLVHLVGSHAALRSKRLLLHRT